MPVIRIPTPLRSYVDGQSEVQVDGVSAGEAMVDLVDRFPSLRQHLFNSEGQLRPFVNLFLGEENIKELGGLETALKSDDRLLLIPSIAGG
ncbi:MAG: MoaD/ThiS family protein [Chloroflexota bacterium]